MNLTSSRRQLTTLIALVALTAALTALGSRPAAAHDALSSATPAAGDTVTEAIDSVTLTFSETPMAEFANAIALNVVSPSGAPATTGTPTAEERTLTVPVTITETGLHTVTWQSVSSDGHTISGSYTFSYAGPIGDEPVTLETATVTAPPTAAPAAEPTASPSSSPDAEPAPSATIPIIAGITAAAVLLLGALLVFRVFRARERDLDAQAPDTEDDPR
jgi:methionine-rich copper-binding protein CopC